MLITLILFLSSYIFIFNSQPLRNIFRTYTRILNKLQCVWSESIAILFRSTLSFTSRFAVIAITVRLGYISNITLLSFDKNDFSSCDKWWSFFSLIFLPICWNCNSLCLILYIFGDNEKKVFGIIFCFVFGIVFCFVFCFVFGKHCNNDWVDDERIFIK